MKDVKGRRVHIGDGVKVLMKPNRGKRKTIIGVVAMSANDHLIGVAHGESKGMQVNYCYADDIDMLVRIADEPQCVCTEDPRGKEWCHGHPIAEAAGAGSTHGKA